MTNAVLVFLLDETFESMVFHTRIWRSNFGGSVKFQFVLKTQVNLDKLFQQVNFYIVSETQEEILYLDLAMRHDVKIIGTRNLPAEIFKDISVSAEVENFKKKTYADFFENVVKKFPPAEYEYFLMHDGLGEVLAFFYWFKEYRKHNQKKILTFCIHPARTELMQICPYVDETLTIDKTVYDFVQVYLAEQFEIKNAYLAHSAPTTLQKYNEIPIYFRDAANNFFNLEEGRQHYLQIPPEIQFERYPVELPPKSIEQAEKIFKDLNLIKGKTVFFNAEGVTFGDSGIKKDFWHGLAKNLLDKGYKVVVNGDNLKIPNCENVFLSLFETAALVGLCGNIVSVVTGFSETICSLNSVDKIQIQIVHHDEKFNWQNHGFSIFGRMLVLKEMQYFGSDFIEKHFESYRKWMQDICSENIKVVLHKWSHTTEEDNLLLEKIFDNIVK